MPAREYEAEALRGVVAAADPRDAPDVRRNSGGARAVKKTDPNGYPVIREWEYGEARVIVFTTLDSCLGAVQIADKWSVRGAHFSMSESAPSPTDVAKFGDAMKNAGFDATKDIYYFGGEVGTWKAKLGHSIWWKARAELPFKDEEQKRWIFAAEGGRFTSHTFK